MVSVDWEPRQGKHEKEKQKKWTESLCWVLGLHVGWVKATDEPMLNGSGGQEIVIICSFVDKESLEEQDQEDDEGAADEREI
jgi:hypothetical protein